MACSFIFGIDENIIQIYNDKDIKFFHKNFIDVALECIWSIGQSKRHYLILEVTVSSPESSLLLIFFANSHPMIGTGEVELGKPLYLPQSIQRLPKQRQWVLVLDCEIIMSLIINTKLEATIWLLIKKDGSSFWEFRESDKTICQVSLNVSFQILQLYWL